MDRLLARLERRLGRFAIPNIIAYIVGGMALVWVLARTKPEFLDAIALNMHAVARGQVWRLVTFLFVPPDSALSSPLWMMLSLYFTWWVGSSLEQHWGSFKLNVYYLIGALATIAAAVLFGADSSQWLSGSLFLAFATLFPDVTILVFFVLPVRVKWLGILSGLTLMFLMARGPWATRGAIGASLLTYAVFFAGHWRETLRGRRVMAHQAARRVSFAPPPPAAATGGRACAICGAREADGADIRVCSCEKCGGKPRTLCLEHARSH
jgi:membrane associated rhomboid family serine protease